MTTIKSWQMSIALTATLSLIPIALPFSSEAQTPPETSQDREIPTSKPQLVPQSPAEPTAQPDTCRRVNVNTESYLNLRATPGGKVMANLPNNTLVTIVDRTENGWVSISSPQSGYVYGTYLISCDEPVAENPAAPENCRRVEANEGLQVYQNPSLNSAVLGTLVNGQQLTIDDRGNNGWVPISSPVNGYVLGVGLILCSN